MTKLYQLSYVNVKITRIGKLQGVYSRRLDSVGAYYFKTRLPSAQGSGSRRHLYSFSTIRREFLIAPPSKAEDDCVSDFYNQSRKEGILTGQIIKAY